jgi:predicted metal-dependent hydrolase
MELWELLDILAKQDNWKITEVWERDYYDKDGELHEVVSYWYELNDKQDEK